MKTPIKILIVAALAVTVVAAVALKQGKSESKDSPVASGPRAAVPRLRTIDFVACLRCKYDAGRKYDSGRLICADPSCILPQAPDEPVVEAGPANHGNPVPGACVRVDHLYCPASSEVIRPQES